MAETSFSREFLLKLTLRLHFTESMISGLNGCLLSPLSAQFIITEHSYCW